MGGQGAYIFGCEGPDLTRDEAAFFAEAQPWGFILFSRNVGAPDQLRRLCDQLRTAVGRDAPILIDQEGGRVARLRPPHWRDWPPPMDQARAAGPDAARALYLRYRLIAEELRALGIDSNCAPLVDVARPDTHPFLWNRCYGETVQEVAERGRAVAEAHRDGGILPVLKHIPGHGRGTVDSHIGLPVVTADRAALEHDFAPFRALADLPMAMTAHVTYMALDDVPATHSAAVIGLIRREIGFDGLLMSDDISMEALGGRVGERAALALRAGCDLILHCNGERAEMEEIAALGQMRPEAQARADRAIAARTSPQPFDAGAALEELDRMSAEASDA
jgi:beta-N-acetylhexosaminidase